MELSAYTVAFINCRGRLTKVLATTDEMVSKVEGGRVRLSYVDTWELAGLQNELICRFILVVDMAGGGIWKFVNDMDRPAFLERELVGLGVDGYW